MKRFVFPVVLSAAVVGGCANQPRATASSAAIPTHCSQLQAEIGATAKAKRMAQEKQQSAWKAVAPFVVAAHHRRARSEVVETDRRLTELKAEAARRGCPVGRA